MSEENLEKLAAFPGQYLTFCLADNWYAVPIRFVREINQMSTITPVPRTPSFVKGVINLRGKIIPVVDLRLKFGLPEAKYDRSTCIVVIEAEAGNVGVIVDQVNDVVDLTDKQIEPSPTLGSSKHLEFLMGMGKLTDRVLILVDIVKSLSKENFMKAMSELADQLEKDKAQAA